MCNPDFHKEIFHNLICKKWFCVYLLSNSEHQEVKHGDFIVLFNDPWKSKEFAKDKS